MQTVTNIVCLAIALLVFACAGLSPTAQAVTPPPDGGYPGGNTAEGQNTLFNLTTGTYNTAVGWFSLRSNTTGKFNTALGAGALLANTADGNTATGIAALYNNTTGTYNTAAGAFALFSNSIGINNTAIGQEALFSNTEAQENTATGAHALENNTSSYNTANGAFALVYNTGGNFNTAIGDSALESNTTGVGNTATGAEALWSNTIGSQNTASGNGALFNNNADLNTAVGASSLQANTNGYENTAIGYQALVNNLGAGNTALGYLAGSNLTTGNDNIDIGADGVAGEGGVIRIGRSFINATYIAGISAQTASGGVQVFVTSDGKLGTETSSARFKEEIKPMGSDSEAILALRPVSFRYKKEIDPQRIPQFGLVAEEVEEVNPDLVVRDTYGRPYSVRYEQVNAMLLNEFLKEHRKVEQQQAVISQLKSTVAKQETAGAKQQKEMEAVVARLNEQAAQIQKMSDRINVSKTVPQIVLNSQ